MRDPFGKSLADVMRMTWTQVDQLYLIPTMIQNKLERDAMDGTSGVSREGFVGAYRDMNPDATHKEVEKAWRSFSRGM